MFFKPVDLMSLFGINASSIHLLVVAMPTPKHIVAARADDFASPSVVTATPHGIAVQGKGYMRTGGGSLSETHCLQTQGVRRHNNNAKSRKCMNKRACPDLPAVIASEVCVARHAVLINSFTV